MKKLDTKLTFVTLLLCFTVVLCGCDRHKAPDRCEEAVNAVLEQYSDAPIDTTVQFGEAVYEENFERLYNFPMKQIDGGIIAYASDGGHADEISIVRAADSSDVNAIRKYLEARLEKRLHDFQNYKPEEVYKLENGRVVVSKQYVFLVISDQSEDMVAVIKGVLHQEE